MLIEVLIFKLFTMKSNVKVTFWLSKSKKNSQNLVPVYLRVWYDYANFTKATGNWVRLHDWDKTQMKVRGNTLEADTINTQLEGLKIQVIQIANQLSLQGKPYNVHTIRKRLEGNETSQISLMRVCGEQIREMEKLKGKTYAPATIIKYKNTVLRLKQFVKYKYKRNDIFLYELNYYFITEFEGYLKHKFDNSTTTCYKHYQRFSRMIRNAMHKGYLEKYPFENYKIRMPKKRIQYLTQAEIDRIQLYIPVENHTKFQLKTIPVINAYLSSFSKNGLRVKNDKNEYETENYPA